MLLESSTGEERQEAGTEEEEEEVELVHRLKSKQVEVSAHQPQPTFELKQEVVALGVEEVALHVRRATSKHRVSLRLSSPQRSKGIAFADYADEQQAKMSDQRAQVPRKQVRMLACLPKSGAACTRRSVTGAALADAQQSADSTTANRNNSDRCRLRTIR